MRLSECKADRDAQAASHAVVVANRTWGRMRLCAWVCKYNRLMELCYNALSFLKRIRSEVIISEVIISSLFMSKNQFRALVVLSYLSPFLGVFYDYFFPNLLVDRVVDYVHGLEYGVLMSNPMVFLVLSAITFVVYVTSFVGILPFKSWARHLCLIGFLPLLPVSTLMGITIYSGWEQFFYDISILLFGVLLALVYYSPVTQYFHSSVQKVQ